MTRKRENISSGSKFEAAYGFTSPVAAPATLEEPATPPPPKELGPIEKN